MILVVQIGLSLMGVGLILPAIQALSGEEKAKKKTPPSVAIAMIVVGVALIAFAFVFLPTLVTGF